MILAGPLLERRAQVLSLQREETLWLTPRAKAPPQAPRSLQVQRRLVVFGFIPPSMSNRNVIKMFAACFYCLCPYRCSNPNWPSLPRSFPSLSPLLTAPTSPPQTHPAPWSAEKIHLLGCSRTHRLLLGPAPHLPQARPRSRSSNVSRCPRAPPYSLMRRSSLPVLASAWIHPRLWQYGLSSPTEGHGRSRHAKVRLL